MMRMTSVGGRRSILFSATCCSAPAWCRFVSALLHSPVALAEAFLWGGMSGGSVCTNLASGVLVFSAAGVLDRRANVVTSNLGVNALGYLGPAVSVGLLAASGAVGLAPWGAEVSRPGVFVVGLAVVLLVNLAMNLRSGR